MQGPEAPHGKMVARGLVLAAAIVVLTGTVARAAEVAAEVDATATKISVEQGGSATFVLRVKATGSIKCLATASNPATATFDTAFSIGPTGVATAGAPEASVPFWGEMSTGGGNCQVTWPGDPHWAKVSMTVRADAFAPLGDVVFRLRPTLATPFGSGDKLTDATPTFLTFTVVPGSDTTPPAVSCSGPSGTPGANGWHLSAVAWACTAHDDGSGLADPDDASFDLTTSGEGAEAWTSAREVADAAGNQTPAGPFGPHRVDLSDPLVEIASPADGATYLLGADARAAYSCADGISGIASCDGTTSDGGALDTTSVGDKTFAVHATDAAGRSVSVSRSYRVVYDFSGITWPGGPKGPRAGSAVPLSWSLGGAGEPEALTWAGSAPCGAGPAAATAMASPGGADLSYDSAEDRFHLVWKTESFWEGCRTLMLAFDDGSLHTTTVMLW